MESLAHPRDVRTAFAPRAVQSLAESEGRRIAAPLPVVKSWEPPPTRALRYASAAPPIGIGASPFEP